MLKQVQHDGLVLVGVLAFLLAGCATVAPPPRADEVQILAINDFHGNLEPPGLTYSGANGVVPVGGAAYLGTALKQVRTAASIAVAAGDLIGASPLTSSLFYDEPTIEALSKAGLALASVGNHEFDRGADELKRMQAGGCRANPPEEARVSCRFGPFAGAGFQYLAANVVAADGRTLFPGTAIRTVGGHKLGFIGMTLKETKTLVSPGGVAGLAFTDEADTANALVPWLRGLGAEAIVLLIHQGGGTTGAYDDQSCPALSGDIMPILARLDPAIGLVISGHTHNAYICRVPVSGGGGERLLTSAGKYGGLVTDIRVSFNGSGVAGSRASFVPVQGEPVVNAKINAPLNPAFTTFAPDSEIAALVARYRDAAATVAERPVGKLAAAVLKNGPNRESPAAELIADGQLFVAREPGQGDADFALMNSGGARTDLIPGPDGTVTYGQIFALQPFANAVVTKGYTGAEIRAVLEQQFDSGSNSVARPNLLFPSANFRFAYDRSKPKGQRIVRMELDGKPLDPATIYRVAINNFLASGGDNFTVLAGGRGPVDGGLDLKATEAWLKTNPPVPQPGRVVEVTPAAWVP